MTPRANAILSILVLLGLPWVAGAQQGELAPVGVQQYFDSNGNPLAGGKLCTYAAGTSTPLDTYTDADLSTAHANPIVLNAAGRPATGAGTVSPVYLSTRAYKFVLRTAGSDGTCATGTEVWTADDVLGTLAPVNVLSKTTNYTVTTTDGKDVYVACDASGGDVTISTYTAVGNSGRRITVKKTDSSSNECIVDPFGAQTIDLASMVRLEGQFHNVEIVSDGANWATLGVIDDSITPGLCQCRLTLTSGTPITTSDVTAAGHVYLTAYGGNNVALYESSRWTQYTLIEVTLDLSVATISSGTNYDIFLYSSSGALTLERVAWTNDTTRATALAAQDGVYVKTGETHKLYVGTIRGSGANQTEDSLAKRFVWNRFNRVARPMRVLETTDTWTYSTAAWQQARASTANQLAVVVGQAIEAITVEVNAYGSNGNANNMYVAIGEDSTTAPAAGSSRAALAITATTAPFASMHASLRTMPAIGYHFYAWLEYGTAATGTWYGDNGATIIQAGIHGMWWS